MKLNDYWLKFRHSFWFLPIFYGTLALVMAIVSMYLEEAIPTRKIANFVPNALMTDVKIGQTILNAIAVSVLTMTTITFSSIMVVLTTYSSQFSPRTLQDFISDVVTQRVLGVFTGGFVYSLLLLLFLKDLSDKKLFLGPGIAVIWAIVCLGFFVFFIHHVATWTQVNSLIDKITTRTQETIRNSFHLGIDQTKSKQLSVKENINELEKKEKITINAPTSGYLQMIKLGPILKKATDNDHVIKVERRIGDYVLKDTPLYTYLDTRSLTKEDKNMYEECFAIGPERNTVQDVEFGIQKLVEIALRAISPGINDPHTAINCINRIGTILAELGGIMFPRPYYYDADNNLRIILDIQSYRELLYKAFYQLRHYAKEDVSVCAATISVLHGIVERNDLDRSIHKIVWDFAVYFIEGIETDALLEWDKQFINEKIMRLAKMIGREKEYKQLKL
ncbi:DUF2254 domain-containing protein [Pseudalkalibacillus salsuginis]|uniref:DUF2254 domain-containing protein n=1 Tax=Pseudalkalibacillus salsuginis TaxID=2910972 RepID=UPI001F25E5B7|nr:DUF2254 domain-containing protein [Pseudalkalibacillus salsuginis]MCF6411144.1 DUF2254 domain-containing protein [Pseudalkalibacillus salsuginis]